MTVVGIYSDSAIVPRNGELFLYLVYRCSVRLRLNIRIWTNVIILPCFRLLVLFLFLYVSIALEADTTERLRYTVVSNIPR